MEMPEDDLIDKLLAQLPAPYPLSTSRSGNETSLLSVRRERTGEIASTPAASSSPLNPGRKGGLAIRSASPNVEIVKEPSGIRKPMSSLLHSQIPTGPKPAPGTPQDRFKNAVLANPLVGTKTPLVPGSWAGSWAGPQPVFRSHAGNTFFSQSQERVKDDMHGGFGRSQAPGMTKTKVATAAVVKPPVGPPGYASDQTFQIRSFTASRLSTNPPVGNIPKGPKKDQPQVSLPPRVSTSHDPDAKKKLSLRCQSLGFNPEWVLSGSLRGKCSYDVKLKDIIVKNDGLHDGEQPAKAAVAAKALNDSELWRKLELCSRPSGSSKASTANHTNGSSATSTSNSHQNTSRQTRQSNTRRSSAAVKRDPVGEPGSLDMVVRRTTDESDRLKLLIMLQKYVGSSIPNYADRPDVCKAFFEGLAMGARLTRPSQSPSKQTQNDRGRSHSPSARHSSNSASYRTRSPLGARTRLTPPPVYHHYPGRPSSSHYSPRNTPLRELPRGPSNMLGGNMIVKKE
ncbi:hypothetical protein SMACR_01571 [Sordaria macrospora]|uniref:Uncharacterized protein n=1 Tax=Sordaria macrospora TaxID=5147 RepID=A0A8S9A597_SORMA|nr:hypothetical protein SMACR_01571 [Sordaria macrospora]WPJ58538.1 hypothetical protein SMAC4_01571 [Sordaria macrospora]